MKTRKLRHLVLMLIALAMGFVACGSESATSNGDGEFPALGTDGIAIGETRIAYNVSIHCGANPFGRTVDGSSWLAVDPSLMSGIDPMPEGWESTGFESLDLVIERTGADALTATQLGTDVSIDYVRSAELFGCD